MNIIPKLKNDINNDVSIVLGNSIYLKQNEFKDYVLNAYISRTNKTLDSEGFSLSILLDNNLKEEEYKLQIKENEIIIYASCEKGAIYGLTTLYLLTNKEDKVPLCDICDAPRFSYRGVQMDVSRHFFSKDEILKVLEEISLVKLNVFHFHFSDDQGFRLQLDNFPELVSQNEGKYFTKKDIKDIVNFAKERAIRVIPEVDIPGHTRAIIANHPELSCLNKKVEVAKFPGIYPEILCPGKEDTFAFLEKFFDEIVPLFDDEVFHIGGDEAPTSEWCECPDCKKKMEENGYNDIRKLQGYFLKRIKHLFNEKYQRRVMCWNDVLEYESELDGDEIIHYWILEHRHNLPTFVNRGGKFIYSDMFDLYYDYPSCLSPMKRTYMFQPTIGQENYENSDALLGFECENWSERIITNDDLEDRLFPRAYALAERAWGSYDINNYKDFNLRLKYFKNNFSNTKWGIGDPKGLVKLSKKMKFMVTMLKSMDKESRKNVEETSPRSDEFQKAIKEKFLK